ncbi:hypothetical protein OUZ56_010983 [Daphnia magna]|uniref:Carboxypeptidase activation peptide domain-containing protein n=1 Tax=Daphnia magna TaxID=35525 RepID=A0ABQ9Z082_9CRUS|nr:hypothetical protein OUZ56_010983 [Daphnia magna]
MKIPFAVLCSSLLLSISVTANVDYSGHVVIRAIPETKDQLELLDDWFSQTTSFLDFWFPPSKINKFVDIRVHPEWYVSSSIRYNHVVETLTRMNINHKIHIADVGELVRQEQETFLYTISIVLFLYVFGYLLRSKRRREEKKRLRKLSRWRESNMANPTTTTGEDKRAITTLCAILNPASRSRMKSSLHLRLYVDSSINSATNAGDSVEQIQSTWMTRLKASARIRIHRYAKAATPSNGCRRTSAWAEEDRPTRSSATARLT